MPSARVSFPRLVCWLIGVAFAIWLVLAITSTGRDGSAKRDGPALRVAEAEAAVSLNILHVDGQSVGGRCNDSNSVAQAAAAATPWCSLNRALAAAPDGSRVLVHRGAYPQLVVAGGPKRKQPITVSPSPGDEGAVSIKGFDLKDVSFVRFEGVVLTTTARIGPNSDNVEIVGSLSQNSTVNIKPGSDNTLIERNRFQVPAGYGVVLSDETKGSTGEIKNTLIRWNNFEAVGADAVQAKNFAGLRIEGNEIQNVKRRTKAEHADAIQTVFGGRDLSIVGNYIHDGEGGLLIKDGAVDGLLLANNTFTRVRGSWPVMIYDTTRPVIVNNTVWGNGYGMILRGRNKQTVLKNNILQSLNEDQGARSPTTTTTTSRRALAGAPGQARAPARAEAVRAEAVPVVAVPAVGAASRVCRLDPRHRPRRGRRRRRRPRRGPRRGRRRHRGPRREPRRGRRPRSRP